MKHILDSSFRYKPSFDTDVRRTFERIRRERKIENPPEPKKVELRRPIQLVKKSGS